MKAKPEVGIQFGAGGTAGASELEAEGTQDVEWAVDRARRYLDAGAYMMMVESEGITESVKSWRTDVPARSVNSLGLEKVMFEAAEPRYSMVHQELRGGGQSVRGSQSNC